MNSDRELLELAAKAAGYVLTDGSQGYREFRCKGGVEWNPLTDDGDALRLAVKLGLSVKHGTEIGDSVLSAYAYFGDYGDCHFEPHGNDPCVATRRAIVRAAAEIGRAMP